MIETIYIFLGLKKLADPNAKLPTFTKDSEEQDDETGEFNFKEKEVFFRQGNPDLKEGVFDYHREFIYTTIELDCDARDTAIKVIEKLRRAGQSLSDSESLSSDSDDHVCQNENHNHHYSHQYTERM